VKMAHLAGKTNGDHVGKIMINKKGTKVP